jgi:hypothetical protein
MNTVQVGQVWRCAPSALPACMVWEGVVVSIDGQIANMHLIDRYGVLLITPTPVLISRMSDARGWTLLAA